MKEMGDDDEGQALINAENVTLLFAEGRELPVLATLRLPLTTALLVVVTRARALKLPPPVRLKLPEPLLLGLATVPEMLRVAPPLPPVPQGVALGLLVALPLFVPRPPLPLALLLTRPLKLTVAEPLVQEELRGLADGLPLSLPMLEEELVISEDTVALGEGVKEGEALWLREGGAVAMGGADTLSEGAAAAVVEGLAELEGDTDDEAEGGEKGENDSAALEEAEGDAEEEGESLLQPEAEELPLKACGALGEGEGEGLPVEVTEARRENEGSVVGVEVALSEPPPPPQPPVLLVVALALPRRTGVTEPLRDPWRKVPVLEGTAVTEGEPLGLRLRAGDALIGADTERLLTACADLAVLEEAEGDGVSQNVPVGREETEDEPDGVRVG